MNYRLDRVCEILKRELGSIIIREISFPVPLVTVSAVDITPDLKQAHIHVTAIGNERQQEQVITILKNNRVLLQNELCKRVVLKNTPHLNFRIDTSIERGSRVLGILDELDQDGK